MMTAALKDEVVDTEMRDSGTGSTAEPWPSPTELASVFGEGIRRTAYRVTGSEGAALEVMQEVFVRVLSRPGFDSSRGTFEGWLQVVTRSTAIDWVRRETAHQRRVARVGALHNATIPVVEEAVIARVQADGVRAAVAQLPDDERQIVLLAYYGGLTYRQVAHELGLAEGTVKSRIRRALTRLAHLVGSDTVGGDETFVRPTRQVAVRATHACGTA